MDTIINLQLTKQDINNILVLISKAEIKGGEAMAVAILQDKLSSAIKPQNDTGSVPMAKDAVGDDKIEE